MRGEGIISTATHVHFILCMYVYKLRTTLLDQILSILAYMPSIQYYVRYVGPSHYTPLDPAFVCVFTLSAYTQEANGPKQPNNIKPVSIVQRFSAAGVYSDVDAMHAHAAPRAI